MCEEIGEFRQNPGEVHCEWRIPNFLSLPEEVNTCYWSPKFMFADACWCLRMYPNGITEKKSEGWINIYLWRMDSGPPTTISYSLGIKKADGTEESFWKKDSQSFLKEKGGWGAPNFLEKSDLQNRKSDLALSGTLTITCTLKRDQQYSTDVSLFGRLWNMSLSLRDIFATRKRCDNMLKLADGKIPVHSLILESRSAPFKRLFDAQRTKSLEKRPKGLQRMFSFRETQMGEVNIEDGNKAAFKVILSYAYSGEPEGLTTENIYEVYKLARKYELKELVKLCVEFMQECLSINIVCEVIAIAEAYQEAKLKKCAKDFFVSNAKEVFKTDGWKVLKRDNPAVVSELLESIVAENAPLVKI